MARLVTWRIGDGTLVESGLLSLAGAFPTIAIHFRADSGKMFRINRDTFPPLRGVAMRVVLAHANLNEALLRFTINEVAAMPLPVSNTLTNCAAIALFVARVAHALLFVIGTHPSVQSPITTA